MSDLVEVHARQIEAATLALGRNDRPAAVIALSDAIETTRSSRALHRQHVDTLIRLARIKQELAQPAQAERLLTEALATGERHLGASHAELVVVLNELSKLLLRQSANARAEPLLERLLAITTAAKGEDHPDVATVLAARAVARRGLGDDAAAEALYRRALAIREKALAPNHMVVVVTLEQLSETCAARGNFVDALALLRRALPIRDRALGADHASVRALLTRIADLELEVSAAKPESIAPPAPVIAVVAPPALPTTPAAPQDPAPPQNASQLVFIYEPERPKFRRVTQPRERMTPQFSAAVAAASLIAAPAPLAAQPAAPTQMTAPSLAAASTHDTYSDSHFSLGASSAAPDPAQRRVPRFAVDRAPAAGSTDDASTGNGITRLMPAAAGALAIALAAYAASSYAANRRDGVKAQSHAEPAAAVVIAPLPTTTSIATITTSAKSAVGRSDSTRTASVPPPLIVATPKAHRAAPVDSVPALPAVPVALPSMAGLAMPNSTTLNADSVVRASGKTERKSYADQLAPTAKLRSSAYAGDRSATSPVLIGEAPQPRYPEVLRAQRMEGEVVVQFLVDETGRVDVSSMKILRSPHELFTAAVRNVLPKFRFEPARSTALKPITEQVQYSIRFNAPK